MKFLSAGLFCCSVSFDGFTIGCSYGIRKFKNTFYTNLIIGLFSAFFTALALFCGKLILLFLPQTIGTYLGAGFLVMLGVYTIVGGFRKNNNEAVVEISRKISVKESLFMGLAVSIDAFSAGLGYGVSGESSFLVPIGVGLCHCVFLSLGMKISGKVINSFCFSKKFLSVLSGVIIVTIGVLRVFI